MVTHLLSCDFGKSLPQSEKGEDKEHTRVGDRKKKRKKRSCDRDERKINRVCETGERRAIK